MAVDQAYDSDPYGSTILRKARSGKAEEECDEERFEGDVAAREAHRQVRDSLTPLQEFCVRMLAWDLQRRYRRYSKVWRPEYNGVVLADLLGKDTERSCLHGVCRDNGDLVS